MNAVKLSSACGTYHVWVCTACKRTCVDEQHAQECCTPRRCRDCDALTEIPHAPLCGACSRAKMRNREEAAMDRASQISLEYYMEEYVYYNDDYEQLSTWIDDPDAPQRAWAVKAHETPELDAVAILQDRLEDHHEGAIEELDIDGLQKKLDEWWENNKINNGIIVDYLRVVDKGNT